jgi:hypothetical protein
VRNARGRRRETARVAIGKKPRVAIGKKLGVKK